VRAVWHIGRPYKERSDEPGRQALESLTMFYCLPMSRAVEDSNRRLLRARDAMDRTYAQTLDVSLLGRIAGVSEAHFIWTFRATFGETPHRYLQRRRVERAMFLLRETDRPVTEICFEVGLTSLGTFSRTFRDVVGESPTAYRRRAEIKAVPTCFTMAWTRPSSFGEAVSSDAV
jgi:AraC-like DNA-binding protein